MSKRINAAKLKAMGIEKVREVCTKHATIAIAAIGSYDDHKKNLHCDLLDQCAAVGRELLHGEHTTPKYHAHELV